MGDVDAALVLLRQNVEDHPKDAASRFGLGRASRTAGKLDEAIAEFRRSLALDPESARTRAALKELTTEKSQGE